MKWKSLPLWFLAAAVLIAANSVVCYLHVQRIVEGVKRVTASRETIFAATRLIATLTNAETGQRGYLITGNRGYLEPYTRGAAEAEGDRAALAALVAGNPEEARQVEALRGTVAEKIAELGRTIRARDEVGFEAAREMVNQHLGKNLMDDARAVVERIRQAEEANLRRHSAEREESMRTATVTLAGSGAFNLFLLGLVAYAVRRSGAARAREAEAERLRGSLERDNTRLAADVEERRRANEALTALSTRLEQSNRELQDFASVASHDLQEPLRKIQAFGDRLRTKFAEPLGEQGRDYVDRMHAAAQRMQTLISDLLSFSRVTTQAQPFAPVDLGVIVRDVMVDLEARVESSGGVVEVGELPTIDADATQMRQLFQNLIANALKFRRKDVPPVVRVSSSLARGGDRPAFEVRVADNGIGFDEKYLDRIFSVFQRLHGRDQYEGTGIGLAVCRKIVERHGGQITATSREGEGSIFLITLPARQAAVAGITEAGEDPHVTRAPTDHDPARR
jgi:signal transduction histidine kinase